MANAKRRVTAPPAVTDIAVVNAALHDVRYSTFSDGAVADNHMSLPVSDAKLQSLVVSLATTLKQLTASGVVTAINANTAKLDEVLLALKKQNELTEKSNSELDTLEAVEEAELFENEQFQVAMLERADELIQILKPKPISPPSGLRAQKTGDDVMASVPVSNYDCTIDPPKAEDDVQGRVLTVTADAGAVYSVNGTLAKSDGSAKDYPLGLSDTGFKVQLQHKTNASLVATDTDSEGESKSSEAVVLNSVDDPPSTPTGINATKTGDATVDDSGL